MENQHFLDENHIKTQAERPTFLTVLCIITFVISGFLLISLIFSTLKFDPDRQKEIDEIAALKSVELMEDFGIEIPPNHVENTLALSQDKIENHTVLTLISFTSILLSLFGAILMFRMKRVGFHLYAVSKIICITPVFILSQNASNTGSFIGIGFFSLIFIAMYATNLKHMPKA